MKLSPLAVEFYPASYHSAGEAEAEELMVRERKNWTRSDDDRDLVSSALALAPSPSRECRAGPRHVVARTSTDSALDTRLARPHSVRRGRGWTGGGGRGPRESLSPSLFFFLCAGPRRPSPLTQPRFLPAPFAPPQNQSRTQDLERVDAWLSLMADLDEEDELEEVEELFELDS
jgi:hypothetical protein